MRIVIVGASGNVGTAVLRAVRAAGHTAVGVSRRAPRWADPYDGVRWESIDVSAAGSTARLRDAFQGADAVVHAAWAIQPSHDQDHLRAVNVDGSRAVFQAVAQAGVPHLVYLSSVGTYAPRESLTPVDESYARTGVPTSSYSRHKAEVETSLDVFEADHPDVAVTRLRPGLILQRDAASEVRRYFLGALVPRPLWTLASKGKLPVLPLPRGLVLQFVHSADVASAVVAAAEQGYRGALNLAAEPVVDAQDLTAVLGGRAVELPVPVVRAAVAAGWHTRLLPTSPGWLDLALSVPVLRTDLARSALGWEPTTTAHDALRDLVAGFADRAGVPSSPVLHP
ncbi:NAD-dependent epimerase/dehydratase family protein [Actinokineospora globicatena]|uniref:NAD-dependent epimerase/dehydratase family protein n=1 Tax=Actinokineospora globicatena TaxID=103729 RepID=UPI0025531DBE|nr:NAD-dependent epimerase/dehydratase family protein [Actinokineospora globicatena]MCP2303781.1 Nucleoside-diphosphate-sugar epimerase [Actinokineospora globicatena]GLW79067.1 nucleoside-diphosphate sugar epimerase [Actinokineospora globicatena]GLW86523.1 nucleoside-diphosphate sugar epimerase [Actinokineospora globicatena]